VSCTGYTDSLVVLSDLVCGATYHMKLAIADGSDNSLKSIVVFKPESFECFEPALALEPDNPFLVGEQSLYEGCVDGIIRITPPSCSSDSVTIYLEYGGSAIMGVDYMGSGNIALPDSVRLSVSDTIFYVTVLTDTQIEVLETLQVTASYTSIQDELITTTSTINVFDYDFPSVTVEDLFICEQETAIPNIINGLEPFTYLWDSVFTTPSVDFTPADSGLHTLRITDVCGHDTLASFFIDYSPLIVPFTQDTFLFCEANLPLVVTPEDQVNPFLEYWWIEFPERDTIFQHFTANEEGRYHLIIKDTSCNRIDSAVFYIAPKIVLEDAVYRTCWEQINELNKFIVEPEGSGFPQGELWLWTLDGDTMSTNQSYSIYNPIFNGTYTVIATQNDSLTGCNNSSTAFITINLIPCSIIIPNIMTPNGDKKNDTFIGQDDVLNAGITADVIVFNRWGNVVYENKRYDGNWEANDLPDGTYYYIVKITGNGLNDIYEGDLTILR
jgi:gliding motility-associated-like protein